MRLEEFASGLDHPLGMGVVPGDPAKRIFVVEKGGAIRVVKAGRLLPAPFLDIRARVSAGTEQGLLGLAFHGGFLRNGRLFLNYTDKGGDTRIVELTVATPSADSTAIASERELLHVAQPHANHNGGNFLMTPAGWLLVGLGDGGSGGDPHRNARNPKTLLGKMLRLDVDPPGEVRTRILAQGMRNPWRYALDRANGDLYIADVGQDRWEEVDAAPLDALDGKDFGWSVMEGTHCFKTPACDAAGLTLPVAEYGHDEGCSITGGVVYRGKAIPSLAGIYFYSDYCTAFLRSFRWGRDTGAVDQWDWTRSIDPGHHLAQIASFGEDEDGEVYVIGLGGTVWKLVPAR